MSESRTPPHDDELTLLCGICMGALSAAPTFDGAVIRRNALRMVLFALIDYVPPDYRELAERLSSEKGN